MKKNKKKIKRQCVTFHDEINKGKPSKVILVKKVESITTYSDIYSPLLINDIFKIKTIMIMTVKIKPNILMVFL